MARLAKQKAGNLMSDSLDLHSGDYVERYNAKPIDRVAALARRMKLAPDARLADFACGNGMLLHALGPRPGSYDGVDFSPDFIASAIDWAQRDGCANYRFHSDDIIAFCSRHPASFDAAATLDFSEHVADDQAVAIYAAIRQALAPGGTLYLHTPNGDFLLERAKDRGILPQFPEHIAVRNGAATIDLLVRAGFAREGIRLTTIAHYNVLKWLHPLSRLPLIGKWFAARLWIEVQV
jgi:2-polyprenyl-6-hydroxyphenyl methylase/3-demethylubiquinone-9 3-methyltransferase